MNLFFKFMLGLLALSFVPRAGAVNVHALYTASCKREVGIILDVSSRQISLLNLKGEIVTVERYDVIYYASYPLDVIPVTQVKNPDQVPLVEIKTYQNHGLVTLVRGWPVDFSQDKISFLDLRGSEIVIDRTSIWQVTYDEEAKVVDFAHKPTSRYEFVHPYAFNSCALAPGAEAARERSTKVYPQQLLSDPVSIKREFDRLAAGHEKVHRYASDQQFYAVPELYNNETSLGLWLEGGDRYGASTNRKNNFTPLLVNRFSSGPFGFQSEFKTGSGPILQSIHEESQTQAYYRLKADYFHFTGMVDPGLLLVGSKYNWSPADLAVHDIRANEAAFAEFGFDYQHFAVELYLGGAVNAGARVGDSFNQRLISIPRVGFRYQNHSWIFNLFGGAATQRGFGLNLVRGNVEWLPDSYHRFVFSVIQRDLKFSGQDPDSNQSFAVEADTWTAAAYGHWRFRSRYWFGLMAAVETVSLQYGQPSYAQNESHVYPKGGAMISLAF